MSTYNQETAFYRQRVLSKYARRIVRKAASITYKVQKEKDEILGRLVFDGMIMLVNRIRDKDNPLDFYCMPENFKNVLRYLTEEIEGLQKVEEWR